MSIAVIESQLGRHKSLVPIRLSRAWQKSVGYCRRLDIPVATTGTWLMIYARNTKKLKAISLNLGLINSMVVKYSAKKVRIEKKESRNGSPTETGSSEF